MNKFIYSNETVSYSKAFFFAIDSSKSCIWQSADYGKKKPLNHLELTWKYQWSIEIRIETPAVYHALHTIQEFNFYENECVVSTVKKHQWILTGHQWAPRICKNTPHFFILNADQCVKEARNIFTQWERIICERIFYQAFVIYIPESWLREK